MHAEFTIGNVVLLNADIGSYIFVILVVISIIAQIYDKHRKSEAMKKRQEEWEEEEWQEEEEGAVTSDYEVEEESRPASTIFEKLEELLGEKNVFDGSPPTYIEEEAEPVEVMEKPVVVEPVKSDEASTAVLPEKDTSPSVHKEGKAYFRKARIKKGFSLKKAVIYSEIINRKY